MSKRKYEQRTDLEKIRSQWVKLTGLHSREEWSAAIVRCATAAEIAANFAVRRELVLKTKLDSGFVDHLLHWANGLDGKVTKLLAPLAKGSKRQNTFQKLRKNSQHIAEKRNAIVHRGEFCNEAESKAAIDKTRDFVETLVRLYEPTFRLEKK